MSIFGKGSGYRYTDAYAMSWVVELATDAFCKKYLDYKIDPQGKTSAQMNHAARSGCRNFTEGCERLMTSYSSGLDLLNVAKASIAELHDDYLKWLLSYRELPWQPECEDYGKVNTLALDPIVDDGKPLSDHKLGVHLLAQYDKFVNWLDHSDGFIRARALLVMTNRARKLQHAYTEYIGEVFQKEGGFRERLGEARRKTRVQQESLPEETPKCPICGSGMRIKHRRTDNVPFWSCLEYPGCKGIISKE